MYFVCESEIFPWPAQQLRGNVWDAACHRFITQKIIIKKRLIKSGEKLLHY